MNIELTGVETGDQLIKQLVYLRQCARRLIAGMDAAHESRDVLKKMLAGELRPGGKEAGEALLSSIEERLVDMRFAEIEIGNYLMPLCDALDRTATREQIFEALNINTADRNTEKVREHGDKALYLITVLHLENSAMNRREDWASPQSQPLQWCHTMAFMNALTTNAKLDRVVHDGMNEFFGGVFGEYRERPLMERLAGRAV